MLAHAVAADPRTLSPQQLALATRDLVRTLDDHLLAEEKLLAAAGTTPRATSSLGRRSHEWYALTEGPVIDLDSLPSRPGFDVVLDRLLQMRRGETIELRSGSDPGPLWQRLARTDPGGYGIALLENGPATWCVEVTRRVGGCADARLG